MPVPENFKGKKGRSGRKTKAEEMEMLKERITQEALVELANKAVYKRLKIIELRALSPLDMGVKDIALPIALKGMKDIKDVNVFMPKPILSNVIFSDDSNKENSQPQEEDTGGPGRDSSQ